MPNTGWKQFERRIAQKTGGRRVGTMNKEDVEHPLFSFECKLYKSLPKGITGMMGQAEKNAENKIPILVMKEKGRKDDNALVVMLLKDWLWMEDKKTK